MTVLQTACVAIALIAAGPQAQTPAPQRPRAELTANVAAPRVAPGAKLHASLRVQLPDGVHVQSNAPRDPSFIATALTIDAPAGVTVDRVTYPAASDFSQAGANAPLSVFGRDFVIEADLTVAAGTTAGELKIPARLRYQACNERVCFPPARAAAEWSVTVVTVPDR